MLQMGFKRMIPAIRPHGHLDQQDMTQQLYIMKWKGAVCNAGSCQPPFKYSPVSCQEKLARTLKPVVRVYHITSQMHVQCIPVMETCSELIY
jgi:hypothetical protein